MFKDNKFGLPLLEITATMNEMNSFLIAQMLIPSESAKSLLWVFEQVDEMRNIIMLMIAQ